MQGIVRKIVNALLVIIIVSTFSYLYINGNSYYKTSVEERFFHPSNETLKPSGIIGHGLGIVGTFLIVFGVAMYFTRKRVKALSRLGSLKRWLEFHIFLCTLGPILILYHTSFKFGGIVAISFWSMVAVWLSGVIGRFIYIQIPRTIEGRELSLTEVRDSKTDMDEILKGFYNLDEETSQVIMSAINNKTEGGGGFLKKYISDFNAVLSIKKVLKKHEFPKSQSKKITNLVKKEITLNRKIGRLVLMQKLFNYWHVAHLPFAFIMLIIMVIHVAVAITFGYKWIF